MLEKIRASELIPRPSDWPRLLGLFAGYAAAAAFGLRWALAPGAGSAVWPASGVAFAGLILGGARLWPAVLLGRLAAALAVHSPQPLWADLSIATATTLGALVPALAFERAGGLDPRLGKLTDMAWLIVLGGLLGAVISGVPSVAALWASGAPIGDAARLLETWCLGFGVGVLVVSPLILSWASREAWRFSAIRWLHLAACVGTVGVVAGVVFLSPVFQPFRTWHLFPVLVWAALAFSVQGASLALALTSLLAIWGAMQGLGPLSEIVSSETARILIAQQFAVASGVTVLVLAAVADERRGKEQIARSERRLRAETDALETLNATGALIAADLDLESVAQNVTDAGVALTGAAFGAFFHNVGGHAGEAYAPYALSGALRSAFDGLGMPRTTSLFEPTFAGREVVRSDDITRDPRYGKNAPHRGLPRGHPPVRSYLAAPVRSRSGEALGALFFGHPEAGVFDERAERLAGGLAGQAAIAIDNARLYQAAQREIAERTRAEEHQRLLINELNHRVKNTLATVQSIAAQTRRAASDPRASYEAFIERLIALSRAHDVLTKQRWEGADLKDIAEGAAQPFGGATGERFRFSGPSVWLDPQTALALAMALHELATNAVKYGALGAERGRVTLIWSVTHAVPERQDLEIVWREADGPPAKAPTRRGFGSRLLERGLAKELNGEVSVDYRREGLVCVMRAKLPAPDQGAEAVAE